MDGFYDGDLKDIWDSDLDPTESLKISTESDLHDWFMERDMKDPAVMILNDKLMSDALCITTQPIKSEHSYSLNSDGDSLPDSPHSLQTKMDDMEDECYPAISLKTATSNMTRSRHDVDISSSVDPKCLAISVDCDVAAMDLGPFASSSNSISDTATSSLGFLRSSNTLLTTAAIGSIPTSGSTSKVATTTISTAPTRPSSSSTLQLRYPQPGFYTNLGKIASAPMTFNLRTAESSNGTTTITLGKPAQQQAQQQPQHQLQYLPQSSASLYGQSGCCTPSSAREGSTSPDICSDIEIDESCIKDEPMSPDSSCPPSPTNSAQDCLSMAKISHLAARTNSDLVFEHKNGCLQLTPASQSLLKGQKLGFSTVNGQNILIPKFNIKTEMAYIGGNNNSSTNNSISAKHNTTNNNSTYGLPLTPPSCSSSDDSVGNLTPEHLLSPLSPNNTSVSISVANPAAASTPAINSSAMRRTASNSSASSCTSSLHGNHNIGGGRHAGGNSSGSTRQPIHTPLISSQPKGSTGVLVLTEEEKRTLQAEGYPIPQKLPLTKAEEKSLKKIRRKIKNKISAQESRRKKKEYVDQLERRVEVLNNENSEQRKRIEALENANANLLSQLHKVQGMFNKQNPKKI